MEIIENFNKALFEFLNQLYYVTNDDKIKQKIIVFETIALINSTQLIEKYIEIMYKYKQIINLQNIHKIIENNYNEYSKSSTYNFSNSILPHGVIGAKARTYQRTKAGGAYA